jgi:ABC-type transporter Mla MlaB component
VSAFTEVDALAVEVLARLQLEAHRLGTSIRLRNASTELVGLIALVGLTDVLPVGTDRETTERSGVEMDG